MNFEKIICRKKVKIFLMSVIVGVCITSAVQSYAQRVMSDISSGVVRLHVVANSDSDDDQQLKLKVRDDVINYLEPMLKDVYDINETKKIIIKNINNIEEEAEKSIKKYGYTYSVTADFDKFDFPTKVYENTKFPKGKYDALKIIIGKGDGQNWWCVLYPQLCFDHSKAGVLSKDSDTKLKNVLTYDEYNLVTSKDIDIKFKIVEWFS